MQSPPLMQVRRRKAWRRKSEDGAIAIITAVTLILIIGMLGLALDLSRSYNRKMELQSVADAAALAAANALDGTQAGVDRAVGAAEATASTFSYLYNNSIITWSPGALSFGTAPNGGAAGWVGSNAAKLNAGRTFFARVDTSLLDSNPGGVENILIPILSTALAETNVAASAVAGRDSLNVMPLFTW